MPFAKKTDALNSKGILKKGFKELTGKDGKIRYFSELPKVKKPVKKLVEKKPVKKVTVKKMKKATADTIEETIDGALITSATV